MAASKKVLTKRAISEQQREWLVDQLEDWQSFGTLSDVQAAAILDLYETRSEQAERKSSAALTTLMGVAALLVGLGFLLLVGYNWAAMQDTVKLTIIFGVILGTHATGFFLRFRRDAKGLSEVVFFLGCLFYGAGIFLVAQIFNLNAHYPSGVWWWAVGVLPFAICLDTLLLHALLVALLGIWCGMEIIGFGNLGWWFFGRWDLIANGGYSLPLLALPGLILAYRKKSVATVALYVNLLSWWVVLQPIAWRMEQEAVYFIGAVGSLMLLISEMHVRGSRFAIPFRLVGAVLTGGTLLCISFYDFNESVLRSEFQPRRLLLVLAIVVLSVVTIAIAVLPRDRESSEPLKLTDRVPRLLRRQWLPVGLIGVMILLLVWSLVVAEPLLPTIVANVGMIFLSLWLMNVGLQDDRGRPFAGGVLYFLIWTVVRYVDLFGDFGGMPGAAMMFFLCGGALFGLAWYWRNRKQMQHE